MASTQLPGTAVFLDHLEQALEDLAVLANAVVLELVGHPVAKIADLAGGAERRQ